MQGQNKSTSALATVAIWIAFAVWLIWLCSFALPAHGSHSGLEAFAESFLISFRLYYGQLWIANIFMLLAPFLLTRAFDGCGRVYFTCLALGALLPAAMPLGWIESTDLKIGFYVWWISMLAMAGLYGVILFLPRKRQIA